MSLHRRAVNSVQTTLRSKPMKNAGVLFLGKGTQGVFSLIYQFLAARTLGVENYGVLMVIHRFTLGAQLVNFQSWQAVVKYGSEAIEAADAGRFERLLGFAVRVDALGACAAFAAILLGMHYATAWFDIPPDIVPLARIYGIAVVPIIFASTSVGVLRLLGRFDLLSAQVAVMPLARVIGAFVLYLMHAKLVAFLWLWLLSSAAGRGVQTFWAWRQLHREGYAGGFRHAFRLRDVPEKGLWRFVFGTNASSTLDLANTQLSTLLISHFLGAAAAGLYNVAQQMSDVLIKPNTKLLIPAIYPELARLTARGERAARTRMVSGIAWLAGTLSIVLLAVLIVFGQKLIHLLFGRDFVEAYPTMVWMACAGVFGALAFPLEPLLLAAGKVRATVYARLLAVIVYLVMLCWLLPSIGLIGAGAATLAYTAVSGALLLIASRVQLQGADTPRR